MLAVLICNISLIFQLYATVLMVSERGQKVQGNKEIAEWEKKRRYFIIVDGLHKTR